MLSINIVNIRYPVSDNKFGFIYCKSIMSILELTVLGQFLNITTLLTI